MLKKDDYIISGVSFPKSILSKIDRDRGPIPRSKFLVKLIEIAYNTNRINHRSNLHDYKRKNILSDDSLGGLTSDKIKVIH